MKTYKAILMHGRRGGEGRYEFTADDALFDETPVRIMRKFMESVEASAGIGHIDYAINAAMKNKQSQVVTVLGDLYFDGDNEQPFVCMISPAD